METRIHQTALSVMTIGIKKQKTWAEIKSGVKNGV
jgi:hypothetical protein